MSDVAEASAERPLQSLRSGWAWARLGDICDVINGRAFKSSEWRESGLPIVRIQNLKDPDAEFNYFAGELDDRHRVHNGDLLFAWSGTPGTSFGAHIWKGPDAALNQHIFNIKFDPDVLDPRYFCLALNQNVSRYVAQAQGGVGLAHITKSKFLDSFIPLAPKVEQLDLVAETEKQFSRLDDAVANLRRVTATLKRYRDAVLAAALDGSVIGERPATTVSIGSIIAMLDQGWSPQCDSEPARLPDEWAVIKTTAIQPMEFLSTENKRLPGALNARPSLELCAGDLLVTRAGPRSRVGVACAVRSTRRRLMLCDKAYRMRFNAAVADARYMEIVLNAPAVRDAINEIKTGISDSGVNLTQKRFSELCVPVPSLGLQARIVAEVDRRLSIVREVETEVGANLRRADALRQASLSRWFSVRTSDGLPN